MNVLISRFSALGDVAMTIPVVYNACIANPGSHFYFLTRKHPAQLFINRPPNLTVLGIDLDEYKGVSGLWRLAHDLKEKYHVDTFVDLHDVLRTKFLRAFLSMKGVRCYHIDKGRAEKRRLTRSNHKVLVQLKPTPQRYEETFKEADIALSDAFQSIFADSKGNPADFTSVTLPPAPNEFWLAIAPFAKHRGKIYPLEQMAKVVKHFASQPQTRIFIFGFGPEEEEAIDKLADGNPNVINMASAKLGMGAELSLLSHCDAMLSMDSANMHLASLVGLRAVSIWGATHPYTGFLGWNQKTADTVQLDMSCRPCSVFGNKPCARGDYHCLAGITPQRVIDKVSGMRR
ncbi:MAG: glycosyltransferase family 9 protein [Muribaculaceae bacterium]|nr:glycosyltransferase family 9 protein [Muribaculaceae bacterium]